VRTPSIADLFVAILGDTQGEKPGNMPDKPGNQAGRSQINYQGAAR
jgi:hypothetical protein